MSYTYGAIICLYSKFFIMWTDSTSTVLNCSWWNSPCSALQALWTLNGSPWTSFAPAAGSGYSDPPACSKSTAQSKHSSLQLQSKMLVKSDEMPQEMSQNEPDQSVREKWETANWLALTHPENKAVTAHCCLTSFSQTDACFFLNYKYLW